ncbi:unnamed protein product [Brassica rapa]|uniref:Uncharacterized protein n=3 Tax=Brassica TaxID=3705 RepID=A0A8D9M515_BRACM|nr:unnamed protein product [Brassica napus]CAG7897852.1 unnamed protein product [Brassica rapa]
MSIFSMNMFRLSKEACKKINSILAKFRWSSSDCKRLCILQIKGRMGFRGTKVKTIQSGFTSANKYGQFFTIQKVRWQETFTKSIKGKRSFWRQYFYGSTKKEVSF